MSRVDLALETPIARTPRVKQCEGMFDIPEKRHAKIEFHFDVPLEEKPWQVGLIVGPSGAGKSRVARALFGEALVEAYPWKPNAAVVDGFGDMPIKDIVGALSAVGFASPPGWIKPYGVLSNGEKFRCNLARAIADPAPLVAIDEFSSVVDRQVARIGAYASAKAVRARQGKRFVAVTCHEDVVEWLQPDWVLEPHVGRFSWREHRRRPAVNLEVVRCTRASWAWFAQHHYLSAELHRGSRCFAGLIDGRPAAFGAIIHFPHAKVRHLWRIHRLVVLPDYQGLGLGAHAFPNALGAVVRALGRRLSVTTSHPALIRAWARSTDWHMKRRPSFGAKQGKGKSTVRGFGATGAANQGRRTASFEYVGASLDDAALAREIWG